MPKFVYLTIYGKVQGVGLRYQVSKFAEKNNIPGWIRNENDKTVSCCLQTSAEKIRQFKDWLTKESTFTGNIVKIDEKWQENDEKLVEFSIKK